MHRNRNDSLKRAGGRTHEERCEESREETEAKICRRTRQRSLGDLDDRRIVLEQLLRLVAARELHMERIAIDLHDRAATEHLVIDRVVDRKVHGCSRFLARRSTARIALGIRCARLAEDASAARFGARTRDTAPATTLLPART